MIPRRGRCLLSLLILTGFLLGTTHGATTGATTTSNTPVQATDIVTTAVLTTPVQITDIVLTTVIDLTTQVNECILLSPCLNGGTCTDTDDGNGYTCNCATGYSGTDCEIVDECTTLTPCLNGGTCVDTNDGNGYNCSCAMGFSGTNCTMVNECITAPPCQNGGTCNDTAGMPGYTCTCADGYTGTDCETDINDCAPNPCENDGTCTDMVDGYTCACPMGFNGTICENDIRECANVTCYNGGTCYDGTDYYNCTCAPGFNGTYCENMCPAGTYGDYCMERCTCVEGANCSNVDGMCTCIPAFVDAACNKSELTVNASQISPGDPISEGDSFTLTCQVNLAGIDLEEVSWYRGAVKLPSMNDQYYSVNDPDMGMYNITIRSAGAEDTGSYNCTAVTEGNQVTVSSDAILISVLVPGQIVDEPNDDRVELNETASLNCTAFSSGMLTLAWERNGKQLSTVNRTNVTDNTGPVTVGGTYYSIILEVSGIVRSDNGIYQCIVMQEGNKTDQGDFTISVIEIPELSNPTYPYNEVATQLIIRWDEYDVNAVTTSCTAFYNQSGSNVTPKMFSNPNKQAIITDLTPFTTYSVSLICQNEVGPSELLMYENEKTFQGAPTPPRDVVVRDVRQTTAVVSWEPPEVTNGELVGYNIVATKRYCSGPDQCQTDPEDVSVQDQRELTLTGLTPGAEYQAMVKAYNLEDRLNGEFKRISSEAGVSAMFTTAPDFPGPPDNVRASDSCTITWEEPIEPNGAIISYTVTMNTYRLGGDTVINTTSIPDINGLSRVFNKSELPYYSDFSFNVTATNGAGEGPPSEIVECRKQTVGEPMTPEVLPNPSAKSHNSFTTTIPTFDDRNGPVSCYEVVVVQLQDSNAVVDSNEAIYSPSRVEQYENAGIGIPYITIVNASIPTNNEIIVGTTESDTSMCYTGGSARRRRSSTPAKTITGVNGPLNPNGIYTSFVRVYSPNEDEVDFKNGPFMEAVVLNGPPPNVAGIVGGIFGFLIAACLIAVIMLILYRRKKENAGDPLMSPTSNGPRENGNGQIMGMQNLGIEDVDEMTVKPIKLDNLEKTIRHKAQEEKRIFWAEYKALPNRPPPMVTMNHSNLPANKDKNRYINIIAYDHTRVKLKTLDSIEGSDYINASYVNGYQSPDKFIAAQGPKDNTLEDFWRMIWEYNCSTVVMLTKCVEDGKDKCSQYWPNKGSITYGRFKVQLDNIKETAEYVIRSFFLSEDGKESGQRSITQFHFLGWPDHGQPDYPSPMMCLIKRVRHLTSKMNHRANIVVHCSAGVGRTGTYIVIDTMLDMMKNEKQVDIYNFIHDIRQQRNTLVQSFVQYFFIHMALLEEHLFGHSDVGMSDFPPYYQQLSNKSDIDDDLTRLEVDFRRACKLGVNGTEQTFANIDQNKDKNRIGHILPFDKNVVKLERLIGEEFSDYINASYITGYQRKNMYIATQGPLPNTIPDFWRMVWESQTSTIVMLTEISQKGHEMCAQYWPLELDETEDHSDITVTLVAESDDDEAFTIRDLEISHAHVMQNIYGNIDNGQEASGDADDTPESDSQTAVYGNVPETPGSPPPTPMKDVRKIRQYHFRGWPEVGVPDSGIDLMRLVNKSHLHQKENGSHPIVVHCSAGAGRTGVFIGLNVLMSRMEEESMIDVFQTVRGLRQQRPHMVQDLAQFRFCYSAMVEYLESQSTEYQNYVPRV